MTKQLTLKKMNQPFSRTSAAPSYRLVNRAVEIILAEQPIGTALRYFPLYSRRTRLTDWPEIFRGVF